MSEKTFTRRLGQLTMLVNNHPQKSELIEIMQQQMADDAYRTIQNPE